jgi:hypothetical protein
MSAYFKDLLKGRDLLGDLGVDVNVNTAKALKINVV